MDDFAKGATGDTACRAVASLGKLVALLAAALALFASLVAPALAQNPITEFPTGASGLGPSGIAAGPDGNIWFAARSSNTIVKMSTAGAVLASFNVSASPNSLTAGPDGAMWCTMPFASKICRVTMAGGVTEFPLPTGAAPWGIATGPDGNIWFSENGSSSHGTAVGRMTMGGGVTEFLLPNPGIMIINDIAAGSDGALWFTVMNGGVIGRIPVTATVANPQMTLFSAGASAYGIAAGPDGALWYSLQGSGGVGRIPVTATVANPQSKVFLAPTATATSGGFVVAGPDNAIWYGQSNTSSAVTFRRASMAGVISEFTTPTANSEPMFAA